MELTDADKERIAEMAKDWKYNKKGNMVIFTEGAEYATIYEREQQAELRNKVIEECISEVNQYCSKWWLRLPSDVKSDLNELLNSLKTNETNP